MIQATASQQKGCYLYYYDFEHNEKPCGAERKVAAQIKSFWKAGLPCDFFYCQQPESTTAKILSCLPFAADGIVWPTPEKLSTYSFVYIRRPRFFSKDFIRLLRETKRIKPNVKIIIEIPTYPYDAEMKSPLLLPALIKDRANRKKLKGTIDRIANLSTEKEVFGVKALRIINGVDLSKAVSKKPTLDLGEIHIVAASYFARWHGLDRLLSGMANYYRGGTPNRNVHLHIAGDGDVLNSLKKQVRNVDLNRSVTFYGYCDSKQLSALYDKSSLAVECLGLHRKGLTFSSSLKSREYLAKGIPFFAANDIDVFFNDPVDFFLQVPRDDSPINVQSIVDFHDQLYAGEPQESLIARVRAYAEAHVGMGQAMKNAIDYIKTAV